MKGTREIRVAIPTRGSGGMDDVVSDVFGRAPTFTIIDIEGKEVKRVKVVKNPATSYQHGAGPIAVKTLADQDVKAVVAGEFGPGVTTLLDHFNVTKVEVKRGTHVPDAIQQFLK